jgi:Tfp pilus assembly protein PilP
MRSMILAGLALLLLAAPASAERLSPADSYTYDGIGKRDPFRSVVTVPSLANSKLFDRFDLEQLRVSAIVEAPDASWAVVQGPEGFHALVKDGSRFGSDHMRVKSVTNDSLILEDFRFATPEGAPVTLLHTLKLPAEETSMPESPAGP